MVVSKVANVRQKRFLLVSFLPQIPFFPFRTEEADQPLRPHPVVVPHRQYDVPLYTLIYTGCKR